jgi:hypothetical protein
MNSRPIGVTILAILAGLAAFLSGVYALQALRILPYFIGEYQVHVFNFWSFLMWALMVWVYVWLVKMLWSLDKSAWLFLAMITVFNLILNFTVMLGAGEWSDVSINFLLNAVVLIYIMLPGIKEAFDVK